MLKAVLGVVQNARENTWVGSPTPLLRLQFTWGQKTLRKQLSSNCTRLGTGGLGTRDLFSTQLLASGGCDLGTSIFLAVTWTGHIHVHVCLSRVRNSEFWKDWSSEEMRCGESRERLIAL